MKELYITPTLDLILIDNQDIITASKENTTDKGVVDLPEIDF